MSRHYYDIYMMYQKGLVDKALNQSVLLEEIVRNNMIFFKDNNASHETAIFGSFKLSPSSEMGSELLQDYKDMQEMFMHDQINFDNILETISELEKLINNLK